MNIWLVSPAWGRFDVTRLALAQRRWLCDELAPKHEVNSVIVADDENLDIAREFGFDTVEKDNSDLGLRFNAGYKYAAEQGAEIFVHIGSDDWAHPRVFRILDKLDLAERRPPEWGDFSHGGVVFKEGDGFAVWREGPTVVSMRKATAVHLPTGTVQRLVVPGSHGCIPWLIPRVALEPFRFEPLPSGKMRGIDGSLARMLNRKTRPNWHYQHLTQDWLVDFKTSTNITGFAQLQHNIGWGKPETLDVLERLYPKRFVDEARRLQAQMFPEWEESLRQRKILRDGISRSVRDTALNLIVEGA